MVQRGGGARLLLEPSPAVEVARGAAGSTLIAISRPSFASFAR